MLPGALFTPSCTIGNVNVYTLLAISEQDVGISGYTGPHAKGVNQLEIPLKHLHATHSLQGLLLCEVRSSRANVFEIQGGTRNRTRDLCKKESDFITSANHWTAMRLWIRASASADVMMRHVYGALPVAVLALQ